MSGAKLALFDLDGTLLSGDTDTLWCRFLVDAGELDGAVYEALNRDITQRYASGAIAPAEYCAFYAGLLAGRSAVAWAPLRDRFVASVIEPRLPPAAHELVTAHRRAGDELILTTATNRFLAAPIAARLGIATLIATELEDEGGPFSGRNTGTLNMREGKVERLLGWLRLNGGSAEGLHDATFYSDSINDLPLLLAVGRPVVVDPDETLAGEARRRAWPVLRLLRA